jgi:hypothetical protein
LTDAEKLKNQHISRVRVRIEHAIAGIKRARIVKDVLRNTKEGFSDLAIVLTAGLHNLRVEQRRQPLRR